MMSILTKEFDFEIVKLYYQIIFYLLTLFIYSFIVFVFLFFNFWFRDNTYYSLFIIIIIIYYSLFSVSDWLKWHT